MAPKIKKNSKNKVDMGYTLKVLWSFLKEYQFLFYLIIMLMLVNEGIAFFHNFVFKYLIDKATSYSQGVLIASEFSVIVISAIGIFLLVRFIGAVLWFFTIRLINKLEAGMMSDIEKKSFWHVLNLSYRFHVNKRTGSLISQFTRGVSKVESFTDAVLFNFIPTIFQLVISIGVISYFNVPTAIALAIMCVIFVITAVVTTKHQEQPQERANEQEDLLKNNLSDVMLNIETVKYFAKVRVTFNHFSKLSHWLKEARIKFWNFFAWYYALEVLIFGLGFSAIFYLSFRSFQAGEISLGSITLIYTAVLSLIPQLFGLMHGYRNFIRSSVDISDLFGMFKQKSEVVDIADAPELKVNNGEIIFEKVSFMYPNDAKKKNLRTKYLLEDFSLQVPANKKVAIVGPSGSGKTTITKLLYRLFDVNYGKISIDGQDIKLVKQHSLRESMSIVPQEPILFNNSLYFNVAYANPKASREEVWKAIKSAKLDKLIARMPLREKTIIGERGVKLSGGEKQRVSIARALLADKRILILDEATSALDSQTEKEIQEDFERLMQNRTSIIIAHRLSTIMNADVIVVMNKGRIVEVGKHADLLRIPNGLYRKLWGLQQGRKEG